MSNVIQRELTTAIPTFWRASITGGLAYTGTNLDQYGSVDIRPGYVRVNNDWTTTVVNGFALDSPSGVASTPANWQWIPLGSAASNTTCLYRLDFPKEAFQAGARYVMLYVETNSGTVRFERMSLDMLVADDVTGFRPTIDQIADKFIGRSIKGGSDAGTGLNARSVGNALAALRNRVVRNNGLITVYDIDDLNELWSATATGFSGNVDVNPT